MVVGDHEVDADLTRSLGCGETPNSTVDRHDDLDPHRLETVDSLWLKTVAIGEPFRNVVDDVTAKERDDAPQHDRRGHAIDVVVAVNGDPFAAVNRGEQSVHADRQVGHEQGVVQLIEAGIEKPNRRLRARDAAEDEKTRDYAVETQGFGEGGHLGFIDRWMVPYGGDWHQSLGASTGPEPPSVSPSDSVGRSAFGGTGVTSRPTSPIRRNF